jgi:large subunit ribosomal protein L28e
MSSDIAWAITRNNSAYLLKKRGCAKPFSTDPLNLTNKHSQRYTGLVNRKAIGIAPGPENKGFTITIKKSKKSNRPGASKDKVTMKAGARRSLHKLKALIVKQRYRKDLGQAALRRAAIIIRSQKPLPTRKGGKPAKKAE